MHLVLADRGRASLGDARIVAVLCAGLAIVLVCGCAVVSAGADSSPAAAVPVESVAVEPLPPHATIYRSASPGVFRRLFAPATRQGARDR